MRFDIVTLFPDFFRGPFDYGVVARALSSGLAEAHLHDLRAFTHDRHRTVDDRPFGGGEGMVLKPQPIFECLESLAQDALGLAPKPSRDVSRQTVILLSAQGRRFTQATARRLAQASRVVLICGRYEGVDERVSQLLCDEELSIGDYVLSGGELAAAIVVDAVVRLLPGVLGHADSTRYESFGEGDADLIDKGLEVLHPDQTRRRRHSEPTSPQNSHAQLTSPQNGHPEPSAHRGPRASLLVGVEKRAVEGPASERGDEPQRSTVPRSTHAAGGLLDYPHYTRPAEFRGVAIPPALHSGDHLAIRRWRRQAALAKTLANRPDLLAAAPLSDDDREFLATLGYSQPSRV